MALLWLEGFEWLPGSTTLDEANTWLGKIYSNLDIGSGAGTAFTTTRGSLQGLELDANRDISSPFLRQPDDADTTVIVGFYWKTPASFNNSVDTLYIQSGNTIQCSFETNSDGTLDFYRGTSSLLDTSVYSFSASNEYYVEFKIVVADGTSGSLEMRVADLTADGDEAEAMSEWTVSSVDTRQSTDSRETSWDRLTILSAGNDTLVDDIYICDGSGSENNDFLGNLVVETLEPDGAGSATGLTPSTGSNWENVDDATVPDGDSTYNTADADAETDLYTMTSPAESGEVVGVQVQSLTRATEGNPRKFRLPVRQGSTTGEGSDYTCLHDDYMMRHRVVELNPDTSALFQNSELASIECGIKRQS